MILGMHILLVVASLQTHQIKQNIKCQSDTETCAPLGCNIF